MKTSKNGKMKHAVHGELPEHITYDEATRKHPKKLTEFDFKPHESCKKHPEKTK